MSSRSKEIVESKQFRRGIRAVFGEILAPDVQELFDDLAGVQPPAPDPEPEVTIPTEEIEDDETEDSAGGSESDPLITTGPLTGSAETGPATVSGSTTVPRTAQG